MSSPCLLASGISLGCKDSIGGLKAVYLTNAENVSALTNVAPDDGAITGITMVSSTKFYPFYFNKNAASFDQKTTVNIENGSNFTTQNLAITFTKMEAAKRNIVKILSQARLVAVVQDQNGVYWYLGETNGLDLKEAIANAGKAKGDLNGYTLTFEGEEPHQAQTVDATYITTASTGFLAANVSATVSSIS